MLVGERLQQIGDALRNLGEVAGNVATIVSGKILLRREGGGGVTDIAALPANSRALRDIRGGEIGLVFQEPMSSLSPVHTIGSQLMEAIRLHTHLHESAVRERAIDMLRQVGIPQPEQRIDSYAAQLSGGLRQRAMIAIALAGQPRLLIADEPTTALDVTTQAQILELLRSIQEETGMAVALITHDIGVIAEMCDYVIIMYLGRVVEQGPVDQIFFSPKHPYTEALLRSVPNVHSEPKTRLPALAGSVPHPLHRPEGCPFHPRCARFMPGTCERSQPRLTEVGPDQRASCFLYPGADHG